MKKKCCNKACEKIF